MFPVTGHRFATKKAMNDVSIEYFRGSKQDIENEKKRKSALMSYFPKTLGTIDRTKYILVDDDKPKQEGLEEVKKHKSQQTARIESFENNGKIFNFESWKENAKYLNPDQKKKETNVPESPFSFESNNTITNDNPLKLSPSSKELKGVYKHKPQPNRIFSDSLKLKNENTGNRLDSVSYNDKGHMSVTFRNDVIGTEGFKPFDPTDKAGCKRRCLEMLAYTGCELSGERIDMTINDEKGRATSQSSDFQKGVNAIDKALDKKQTIILNVDYKDGTASSADKAGDHFIIVVGKTVINGITYYHFYDPATQFTDFGTANTNVLYIKDGFLQGNFVKRNGSVNKYKVTSVRLNK